MFKVIAMDARDQFEELRRLDTSTVDNGRFDPELIRLYGRVQRVVTQGRRLEGISQLKQDEKGIDACFELWLPALEDCERIEREFYLNPDVNWAVKRSLQDNARVFALGILAAIAAGLILAPNLSTLLGPHANSLCRLAAGITILMLLFPGPFVSVYYRAKVKLGDRIYMLKTAGKPSPRQRALTRSKVIEGYEGSETQEADALHQPAETADPVDYI
jgi:hypothetical protein